MIYDICIIGGGIVGVSTAYHLKLENKKLNVLVLEKDDELFLHQSSRNSGVIHAGIYYKKGSLKSKFCTEGLKKTYQFCSKNGIKADKCGKIVISTSLKEDLLLNNLFLNAKENELNVKLLSNQELKKLEPNLKPGNAIHSPDTGVVNWTDVAKCMLEKFIILGGLVKRNSEVVKFEESSKKIRLFIKSSNGINTVIESKKVISCGGLYSDRILANGNKLNQEIRIIPFKGGYYQLNINNLFSSHIYPVPDPSLPFLGIHFTKTIDNKIIVGPNASLGLSREGYSDYSIDFNDIKDIFFYRGFWNLLGKYKNHIFNEFLTSMSKKFYFQECIKYTNKISMKHLDYFRPGIRAQAVDKDGFLMNDFVFQNTEKMIHVINAPSPAATSSIPIGIYLSKKVINL